MRWPCVVSGRGAISECLVFILPFFAAAAVTTEGNGMSREVWKMMVSERVKVGGIDSRKGGEVAARQEGG